MRERDIYLTKDAEIEYMENKARYSTLNVKKEIKKQVNIMLREVNESEKKEYELNKLIDRFIESKQKLSEVVSTNYFKVDSIIYFLNKIIIKRNLNLKVSKSMNKVYIEQIKYYIRKDMKDEQIKYCIRKDMKDVLNRKINDLGSRGIKVKNYVGVGSSNINKSYRCKICGKEMSLPNGDLMLFNICGKRKYTCIDCGIRLNMV